MKLNKVSRAALTCAMAAGCVAAPSAISARDTMPQRPNILLIIADDIGQDLATGMYPGLIDRLTRQYGPQGHNNPNYAKIDGTPASTPVMDRFARQGMIFTDGWAQPFCSPTRASILTGLYASKTGVITYADGLSQNHDSFVKELKDQGGYETAVFGKWHIAGLPARPAQKAEGAEDYPGMKPEQAGFDLYRGDMHAAIPNYWNYPIQVQDAKTAPGEWRTEQPELRSLPGIEPTRFAGVAKGADTIEWIGQQQKAHPGKPWFVWLAFNLAHATAGHDPSQMAIPDKDTLDAKTIKEIDACGGKYGTQDPGDCPGEAQMRAMTNSMDTIIGKVLDYVDKIPNTYVIIVGDNGTPMYPKRLGPNLQFIDNMYITREGRGKGTAFESGARVEWAIRGPGIKPGSTSSEFVHVVDLYNTILDMAHLPKATMVSNSAGDGKVESDSISLMPILDGEAQAVRDPVKSVIITEDSDLMKQGIYVVGARNKDWKVVCGETADNCAFYNLVSDQLEEYPLDHPKSCDGVLDGVKADDPAWNYCYLQHAVATNSILTGHKAGSGPPNGEPLAARGTKAKKVNIALYY
jgi:arylsulfatase A-like enzyme